MPDIFVAKEDSDSVPPPLNKDDKPIVKAKEAEKIVVEDAKELMLGDVRQDVGLFHSYCIDPSNVKFANQDTGEKILLFLRAHLITTFPWIVRTIILLILPVVLSTIVGVLGIEFSLLPSGYTLFILIFYFYVVILFAFINYVSWFYNIGLVTNVRVLDVDLKNLVQTHVAGTKLVQIEDVGFKRTGALRSIFDYGDVEIQTAAENANFEFLAVPHPNKAVNIVEDLIEEGKSGHSD